MKFIKPLFLIGLGVIMGIIANRNREYLINAQFIRDHWHFRKVLKNKAEIASGDRVMICFTFGQSNAGNYGMGRYTTRNKEIYNYYKGDLYKAREPLLGPDGGGSSVWTRVADMLIDSGFYKKIIIVPCAIGQTPVKCWAEGDCKEKLEATLNYMAGDNLKPTHIFWQQGETDNVDQTTKEQYKESLTKVIQIFRDKQITAPFFTSITSYFPYNNNNPFGMDAGITSAQMELTRELPNVKQGPDTDSLNLAYYRTEAVHFTEKGLDRLAYEWFKKIKGSR